MIDNIMSANGKKIASIGYVDPTADVPQLLGVTDVGKATVYAKGKWNAAVKANGEPDQTGQTELVVTSKPFGTGTVTTEDVNDGPITIDANIQIWAKVDDPGPYSDNSTYNADPIRLVLVFDGGSLVDI